MKFRLPLIAVCLLACAACSHMPSLAGLSGAVVATPGLSARDRMNLAVESLEAGHRERAKVELEAILAESPGDNTARRLLSQIDGDPRAMLGERHHPYTVQTGDTMTTLAERFLGDPLMFYALSRYNGIDAPNQMQVGATLMIPESRRARPAMTASTPRSTPAPAAPAAVTRIDPARANQLRLQALQQLNTGAVDRAVSLLRQARELDAANPAIQRDLDRATRIQTALNTPN